MTRRAVLEYGGLDILVASAGLATSAPITETTLDDWELNYAVLARGYFLAARETFRVLLEQGRGGSIVFVASKNALVAGATPPRTRRRRRRRCTSRAASPRRAARTGSASTPSTRTPSSRARASGRPTGRPSAPAPTASARTSCRPSTGAARSSASTSSPRTSPRRSRSSPGPRSAKSTGNVINVDGGVTAAYPR